ncbi:MAG: sulfatase [Puniceicoccaceae bacterium]
MKTPIRSLLQLLLVTQLLASAFAFAANKPNLLVIHTDEHNFRTLGCYRDLMSDDQSYVWGKGIKVDTPHIDSLAEDGALCTSYYAASPVCTPSRAAMVSGLYPIATGSPSNDMPMHDGLVTFAEVLGNQGYATAYVGKWHLDGDAKPGFEPARKFGFQDNRHMFNRGHWKILEMDGEHSKVGVQDKKGVPSYSVEGANKRTFTTDFLTDRVIEIMDRDKDQPFCIMLSYPDPHGPNSVRPPYDTMYEHMHFENPRTMEVPIESMPKWAISNKDDVTALKQDQMQRYFGMVHCIDDNVGRLLKYLEDNDLADNTIVVFTSDHGDLMGEHRRHNKGVPYETSAKIPFLIRYPGKIQPGKIIHKAYTNVDFAPTILGLMNAPQIPGSVGLNDAKTFLGKKKIVNDDRVVYLTNSGSTWVAGIDQRHKLVLSVKDTPWLFDLLRDPDELINFYDNPEYGPIAVKIQKELIRQMKLYDEPGLTKGVNFLYSSSDKPPQASSTVSAKLEGTGVVLLEKSGIDCNASGAKKGTWNRGMVVPPKSFAPNSQYLLKVEWTSKGLEKGSQFYANFISKLDKKKNRQNKGWTGASGKSGKVEMVLNTNEFEDWELILGIRGGGHMVIDHVSIQAL